jgi:hypothetical protein
MAKGCGVLRSLIYLPFPRQEWIPLQSAKAEWGLVASRASVPDDYVAKQLYEEVAFFRLIKACTEVHPHSLCSRHSASFDLDGFFLLFIIRCWG